MTSRPACAQTSLIARIFARAEAHPEAPALVAAEETVSYGALRARVARIGAALQAAGVGAEGAELVGVCLPRGIEAVCAVLGVLAAGAAYVPIEPRYPPQTRRRIARGAGLTHIVADDDAFAGSGAQIHSPAALLAGQGALKEPAGGGDRLFHVLYTSGSTDEPKGVLGSHAQMQARLDWLWRDLPIAEGDICCHKTPLHFVDASLEIFGTLALGRPLVIAPDVAAAEADSFLDFLAAQGVTRLSLVVSQLRSLLLAAPDLGERAPKLGLWIVSGEPLGRDLVETFREAAPGARLVNLYGCSEAPEISHAEAAPAGRFAGDVAPIGRLIDGFEAHIVDEDLKPVARGSVGELLVGGPILAQGYLGRPEETARRFIDNPFGGTRRLYRTGDRVRMTDDGLLWHEGRADDLVKLRGHRVELSAVEAALTRCDPALAAVKAIVQQDPRLPENRSLVAFVAPESIDVARLAERMQAEAPAPMQPQRIIALPELPTTPSGKIDRRRLAEMAQARFRPAPDAADATAAIARLWRGVLMTDAIGVDDPFFEIGGDSLRLAQLHRDLKEAFPAFDLSLPDLLAYPTIAAQARYLAQGKAAEAARPAAAPDMAQDIAVIGLACRFPGADTPEAFWANLRDGVDSITDFDDAELDQPDAALRADPDYVKAGAVLDDVAGFDAAFFGMSEAEAARLDPQHRILLECAWEALERAGLPPGAPGRVGVFAGSGPNSYFLNQIATPPVTEATMAEYQDNLAADRNFLATRIAYRLGLTGPALTVQSACSTGLVVAHQACQALRAGECEAALAAAVAVRTPQRAGYLFEEGMIRSPDGRCRAFDERAQGVLFGNGAGVVVLKPLAAARANGDPVLAVIKGSAVNNDGVDKIGYTAPSVAGQADVVAAALTRAGAAPETIGYVEAHGTGTRLGDPIEVSALTRAHRRLGRAPGGPPTLIGSVKTNIGHLDEAAGMAGLIKTVLALQHGQIPPSLHYDTPNPAIDFEAGPFSVAARLTPWPAQAGTPRRAGVSSFGMGGTNCHMILEQAPEPAAPQPAETTPSRHLLVLSAPTAEGLTALAGRYRDWLAERPDQPIGELCAAAAVGRRHFDHRLAVGAATAEELREGLAAPALGGAAGRGPAGGGKRAFLFSGQGAQYVGMARQLHESHAPFRTMLDRCAAILDPLLPRPLFDVMFGGAADDDGAPLLSQTRYTQPALVAVELSLVALWRAWGITPDIVLGHSIGEYAAAHTAGVLDLRATLSAVAERGRLMQALPGGTGMLATGLDEASARALLAQRPGLCVAGVNAPQSTVLAGDEAALRDLAETLDRRGVRARRLDVSHAFHAAAMEPILAPLEAEIARHRRAAPSIPVVSNIDGTLDRDMTDPAYWAAHARAAVRFADGVETLRTQGVGTLIEIGPGASLLGLVAEITAEWPDPPAMLPSLRRGRDERGQMLDSLGHLYRQGSDIAWREVFAGQGGRRPILPTTPFQRRRCWIEREPARGASADAAGAALQGAAQRLQASGVLSAEQVALVTRVAADIAAGRDPDAPWSGLLHHPVWRPAPAAEAPAPAGRWLILADRGGVGAALAARAAAAGVAVACLSSGESLDAAAIMAADRVVCLRALDHAGDGPAAQQAVSEAALRLVAHASSAAASPPRVTFVTRGAQSLAGQPGDNLAQALVWGVARTLALENPAAWGGIVDLDPGADSAACAEDLWAALPDMDQTLCRGAARHVARLEPAAAMAAQAAPTLRADAVYLVTGGLGALGLETAAALADLGARNLVLTSRRGTTGAARGERLDALRRRGVVLSTPAVDVADEGAMQALFRQLGADHPPLRGVFHAAGSIAAGGATLPESGRIAETLSGKAEGAAVLHRLTRDLPLDHFVLFSSAAALLGLAGHADYAAANAFLDALAARRRAEGLPALSLNWGDWSGQGMAAGAATEPMTETGLSALSLTPARAALRALLGQQGQVAAIDADWPRFVDAFNAHQRFLAPCLAPAPAGVKPAHDPQTDPRGAMAAAPVQDPAERIAAMVATILGCKAADIDRQESLLALGLDSLMLITLRNRMRRDMGVQAPLPRMLQGPSVADLAAEAAGSPAPAPAPAPEATEDGWTTVTI